MLFNGIGGPDNATAIAASPFDVSLGAGGAPSLVPAPPCATMVTNVTTGEPTCYFGPEPCSGEETLHFALPVPCVFHLLKHVRFFNRLHALFTEWHPCLRHLPDRPMLLGPDHEQGAVRDQGLGRM